jgi:aspartate/methionine/tyrosine aminotransferase
MRALLTPEDHVIVITPAYQSLLSVAAAAVSNDERNGDGITTIDVEVISNRWTIDINKIKLSIKNNTKMMIMNFPHNPTGALLTKDEQNEIINICKEHKYTCASNNNNDDGNGNGNSNIIEKEEKGIILFFDEVYRGLEINHSNRLEPICTLYDKGISLGVMSKSLGMAGLRIGWLVTQNIEMLNSISMYKHYLSICNSGPGK